jgi:hypothetical protein
VSDMPDLDANEMPRHYSNCAMITTHHLTCTCGAYSRWRAAQIPLHDPQCSWVRMHPNGLSNMGNCDCGQAAARLRSR